MTTGIGFWRIVLPTALSVISKDEVVTGNTVGYLEILTI